MAATNIVPALCCFSTSSILTLAIPVAVFSCYDLMFKRIVYCVSLLTAAIFIIGHTNANHAPVLLTLREGVTVFLSMWPSLGHSG